MKKINLVIYGATGSIGKSVLSIIKKNRDKFNIQGITCDKNYKKLIKIGNELSVKKIGFNKEIKKEIKELGKFNVYHKIEKFHRIIDNNTDIIIFAITGLAGLDLISKLIKSGKKIGIANKECIISLGNNIPKIARSHSTELIPLDSEHNSIYHLLNNKYGEFESITITASGGPFRNMPRKNFNNISLDQALAHPIWRMGKKITVDSATMMNKALEIIEAKYLFDLEDGQINAIIHPQAIIHAIINYKNGISIALMNKPDMRIPISSLFFKFESYSKYNKQLSLVDHSNLEFFPIDPLKFPAIKLGREVMKMGGLAPNALNYLNEILVKHFLNGSIKFLDIVHLNEINLEKIFAKNSNIMNPKLIDIKNINSWIDKNLILKN